MMVKVRLETDKGEFVSEEWITRELDLPYALIWQDRVFLMHSPSNGGDQYFIYREVDSAKIGKPIGD